MKKVHKLNWIYSICIIAILSLVIVSCNNDDNNNNVPSQAEFTALINDAVNGITQNFQFLAESGVASFTSSKGVVITIDGNCLTLNGNPVTGTIDLEYIEVFDGGTMLATNKTTMGFMPNGDKAMLLSGGEFYINATKNGQQLEISCSISLNIPTDLTNAGGNPEMTLWTGIENDTLGGVDWEEQVDPIGTNGGVFIEGQGTNATYYALVENFGWTNVDCFYIDPNPKTTILAAAPNGYDNQNSVIYLHYDGLVNSLARLDTYDNNTNLFSEHYGQIPIGLACHMIFVSEDNGQWRYAIKSITISANAVYNFTLGETVVGSEAQLISAINALP
jgi:hypothetical protein